MYQTYRLMTLNNSYHIYVTLSRRNLYIIPLKVSEPLQIVNLDTLNIMKDGTVNFKIDNKKFEISTE